MKRYTARSLTAAAREAVLKGRNDDKFVIIHAETGLWLEVTATGSVFVDGDRDDATGFDTQESAMATATRLGLAGKGYKIRRPLR